MALDRIWIDALANLESAGRLRALRAVERLEGGRVSHGGRTLLDFSSNDYLGLSRHPELARRAADFAQRWGAGASSSRLISGNLEPFAQVEEKVAAAKGTEAAMVLASGWQTNAGVLPALFDARILGKEPLVFSDKLNHASIHQGCRAAGVRQLRFRHLDLDHLEALLIRHQADSAPKFVVSESVFSMDGDQADVPALVALAERFGAFLYLDEAHATGVLGKDGFGLAAGLGDRIGLVMGTFSKALGGFGGYVACSKPLRDYLVNRCSGLVYSTGLPPAVLGAMDAALDLVPTMGADRLRLQRNAASFRDRLRAAGIDVGPSTTQIVPAIVGADRLAVAIARRLEEEGFMAAAIRPPTVPEGTSRLRFSLSAAHRSEDVERLADATIAALQDLA
ncbi:8-amino-7-oxononanoate synthase [Vulgatibacter incomptus]|uniref:8-amino-7-ketopelargonate synthase n=1 Tax=Vulgatibacter incomptus TaxID=1391653 RepID=A0A0K1PET4_9BACT|nr:8-amino-7-oxononanoate synthase [Vulgatibacter incomptus]AKU92012.1 8-amino-7-oxononanoate synthase [Vulgatibacter incomptus]